MPNELGNYKYDPIPLLKGEGIPLYVEVDLEAVYYLLFAINDLSP